MARRRQSLSGLEVSRPLTSVDQWASTDRYGVWPEVDISDGSIDLRVEMASMLEKHGHYVYLRRSTGRHCACFNEATQEANPDCSFCTGEGWQYEDVKVLARKSFQTDPMTSAFLNNLTPLGRSAVGDVIFWIKWDEKPNRMDKIVEVTLDADGEPVIAHRIEMIWEINFVHDYRDKWGRVEFWGCWVHNTGLTK